MKLCASHFKPQRTPVHVHPIKKSLPNKLKTIPSPSSSTPKNHHHSSATLRLMKTKPIIIAEKKKNNSRRSMNMIVEEDCDDGKKIKGMVVIGAASLGFALLMMAGVDGQEALAFGPEGPLVEEFWDNMRRYGLYFLTVSTGVIYTILQPIIELLKNPISAILLLIVLFGSVYIVSQVLNAMVGISSFDYKYGY